MQEDAEDMVVQLSKVYAQGVGGKKGDLTATQTICWSSLPRSVCGGRLSQITPLRLVGGRWRSGGWRPGGCEGGKQEISQPLSDVLVPSQR